MFAMKSGSALPIAVLLASLSTLSACGGGGDSSSPSSPVATDPSPPATPTPPTTPTPPSDPSPPVQITLAPNTTPIAQAAGFSQSYWPAWTRTGTTVYDGVGCASGNNYHIHAMLSFYKDGTRLELPDSIGRNPSCDYGMHTHDGSGVVHIETETVTAYTMGQFFAEWGQPISAGSIAGLPGKPAFYIIDNEKITPFTGDPSTIQLTAHREILIVVGTPPTQVPRYDWADSGL